MRRWTEKRISIEEECVAELRALTYDCENIASRVLGAEGHQRVIRPLQRLLVHFGTFQQNFPLCDEPVSSPARPEEAPQTCPTDLPHTAPDFWPNALKNSEI